MNLLNVVAIAVCLTVCLQAMVLFIGVRTFKTELHSVMKAMCADPSTQVRKAVAAGFHEVLCRLSLVECNAPMHVQYIKAITCTQSHTCLRMYDIFFY